MSIAQYPALFYISDNYDATSGSGNDGSDYFLSVQSDTIRLLQARTIVNSTDAGYPGEYCFDGTYLYYCVSGNGVNGNCAWVRVAMSSW